MILQVSLVLIFCLVRGNNLTENKDFSECDSDACYGKSDNIEFSTDGFLEKIEYPFFKGNYTINKEDSAGDGVNEFYQKSKRNITEHTVSTEANENSFASIPSSSTEGELILKVNFSVTPTPPFGKYSPLENVSSKTSICFCDVTLNQCDINCCCDKDCSQNHYKVFTSCIDSNGNEDSYNCYSSEFIYKNNTSLKLIKSKNSLFCIVKDNSGNELSYKTKPVIKSLEDFNKNYIKNHYAFSLKSIKRQKFRNTGSKVGLPVWVVQNEEITALSIPYPSVGYFCNSQLKLKYLVNQKTKCSYQLSKSECGTSKLKKYFEYLRNIRILANPGDVNKSDTLNKVCESTTCLSINLNLCYSSSVNLCIRLSENLTEFGNIGCWNTVPEIQYLIAHNGSEGIKKFEVNVWMDNTSKKTEESFLQTIEVKYSWISSSKKTFKKSGNPGYLTGKPLLSGSKVYLMVNNTGEKKEAIQLSFDTNDWLTVLGSEKGACSSKKRIPVNFRENSHHSCLFPFTKELFGKEECKNLQQTIFRFLIGKEIVNVSDENNLNKFVAVFGNSKVEEIEDWVQVLIDVFPITSSQVGFKYNYDSLICKNIITDLFIDIVYAKFGSYANPQSKILGVSYHFGSHKDLIFDCDGYSCKNTSFVQFTKLSTVVHFLDASESPNDAFAVPLGLEVKLPHDFFYPFFSKGSVFYSSRFLLFCVLHFAFVWL